MKIFVRPKTSRKMLVRDGLQEAREWSRKVMSLISQRRKNGNKSENLDKHV